jgi:hypothetical protein
MVCSFGQWVAEGAVTHQGFHKKLILPLRSIKAWVIVLCQIIQVTQKIDHS